MNVSYKNDNLFNRNLSSCGASDIDPQWLDLEERLRQRHLLVDPDIRHLASIASNPAYANCRWARRQIVRILVGQQIDDMRSQDVFRPYGPAQLLSNGKLHLINQADGLPWLVPTTALPRGVLLTGPQGSGKSRLLIYVCTQLNKLGIPYIIIDPKEGLKDWAGYLNATYIDIANLSLDLKPPSGISYSEFLPALMPQLADIIGVIYGTEILQQAASVCIELRKKFIQKTGKTTQICLYDIYQALPFVQGVTRGRRHGYCEAVSTGLSRIITGSGNLFKCRKGADLSVLINTNVIIGSASLTDEFATRFLPVYLLEWASGHHRGHNPTDNPRRVFIFDDASRYLAARGAFEKPGSTSAITHLLAKLRSTGNCTIFTTQVPHLADPGVTALSHTVICVGGLQYGPDSRIIAEMMGLTEPQRIALSRLRKRQAVGICGSSDWTAPVHGYTVEVNK